MKWKRGPVEFLPEKTFLIIKDDLESLTVNDVNQRKKSKSAADTGTWPPKVKKLCPYSTIERPKTANLEKPSILDPSLVNKLDMSLLSKEVLSDSMTQIRHGLRKLGGEKRRSTVDLKVSRQTQRSFEHVTMDNTTTEQVRKHMLPDTKKIDDNNNRNKIVSPLSSVKMIKSSRPPEIEVFTNINKTPEPCTTCGRPDQPERLHSHPKGLIPHKIIKDSGKNKELSKKTIQKPVALNFKSEKTKSKEKILHSGENKDSVGKGSEQVIMKKGPRTVTCYICAREFGTASFPIHEPKCMQKWERENNSLSPSQKRSPPQRPIFSIDQQEWNTAAWELSQTQLVPCWKCGRTFLPDRLPVHQKSCKALPMRNSLSGKSNRSENSSGRTGLSTVQCQVCGRNFGATTIKIHEPQCLKRLQSENDNSLSLNASKKESQKSPETIKSSSLIQEPVQKKTITCYICGRDFGSTSIEIHEPQCLKKWHIENGKLPANQRRPEPKKPELIFSSASTPGNPIVDWAATSEARWKSHLGQLIACKHCKRTFNPDRVTVHERTCKGTR